MCYTSGHWHLLWVILSNQIHYTCCESSCQTRPVDKSSCGTRQTSHLVKPDRLRVILSNQTDYESSCQTRETMSRLVKPERPQQYKSSRQIRHTTPVMSHLVKADRQHLPWVILFNKRPHLLWAKRLTGLEGIFWIKPTHTGQKDRYGNSRITPLTLLLVGWGLKNNFLCVSGQTTLSP